MNYKKIYWTGMVAACLLTAAGVAGADAGAASAATSSYKPTVDDWIGVNAAVDNYTLGLELHDPARFEKAFWPEATVTVQPEPGKSFTMPYRAMAEPPKPGAEPPAGAPKPPAGGPGPSAGGAPMTNAIGTDVAPWHLSLSHHFEFQSATRATHYGYFVSVYPDLKTKVSTVGLPGHYEDTLERRNGEWRILKRTTVIGGK